MKSVYIGGKFDGIVSRNLKIDWVICYDLNISIFLINCFA